MGFNRGICNSFWIKLIIHLMNNTYNIGIDLASVVRIKAGQRYPSDSFQFNCRRKTQKAITLGI